MTNIDLFQFWKNRRYLWDMASYKFWAKLIIIYSNFILTFVHFCQKSRICFRFQMRIKLICVCIISIFQLIWAEYIKLLHKNKSFTISHLWFPKYWPWNLACVVKMLIFQGQYSLSQLDISHIGYDFLLTAWKVVAPCLISPSKWIWLLRYALMYFDRLPYGPMIDHAQYWRPTPFRTCN